MPWLGETVTLPDILNYALGYAPIENAEAEVEEAVIVLCKVGWLRQEEQQLFLTADGLEAHDEAEREIMKNFFAKWPSLSEEEISNLLIIFKELNAHLEEMKESIN